MDGPLLPGIYDMPESRYHADPCPEPSLSSSIARILLTHSPLHAAENHPRLNPDYEPDESARFDLGATAHAVLLERDWTKVQVIDPADHTGKNGAIPKGWTNNSIRAARDEARAQGLIPVLKEDAEAVQDMVSEALGFISRSEIAGLFDQGVPEQTFIWQETVDRTPIWLRARLDWIGTGGAKGKPWILDYKTCQNAAPDAFSRQIGAMGYDIQAAFYCRGVRALDDIEQHDFIFLAQEIAPPYACSLHMLSPVYLEMAEDKVQRAIDLWANCIYTKRWPSYPTDVLRADPPPWAYNQYISVMTERALG